MKQKTTNELEAGATALPRGNSPAERKQQAIKKMAAAIFVGRMSNPGKGTTFDGEAMMALRAAQAFAKTIEAEEKKVASREQ